MFRRGFVASALVGSVVAGGMALQGKFKNNKALNEKKLNHGGLPDHVVNNNDNKEALKDALSPQEFREYPLKEVIEITPDTNILKFAITEDDGITPKKLNSPTASCLVVQAEINGEQVIRPYTPVNKNGSVGELTLVVKSYPNGKMSKYINELNVGDKLSFKGPFIKFEYKPNLKKEIGLIVGGSGITPAWQIIQEVVKNPQDKTRVTLLFANKSPEDIILKRELDNFAKAYPDKFKVYYTVDNDPSNVADTSVKGRGFVNENMIRDAGIPLPKDENDDSVLVAVCGPPKFYDLLSGQKKSIQEQGELTGLLKQMGFNEKNVFKF
ncbi:hypothetical protein ABK040_002273 [Willaertia magna]